MLLWGCRAYDSEFEAIVQLEDRRAPVQEFLKFTMHPRWEVQRRAAVALGRLRDPEAATTLAALLSSGSPEVRVEAAFALGQLALPATNKTIIKLFAEEKDLEVRLTLLEALSKVTRDSLPPETDSTLARQLEDDIPIVRAEAASALGRLAQRKLKRPQWRPKLAALLQDQAEEARWRAAYALMRLEDSSAAPALLVALQDRSARVRVQAARALGVLTSRTAHAPLKQAAHHDGDWRVRVNAAAALGKLQFSPADFSLDHFPLADENLHVRLTAISALGNALARLRQAQQSFEAESAKTFLQQRLTGNAGASWHEQAAVVQALAQWQPREALPLLLPLVNAPEPRLRVALANALALFEGEEAFSALEKLASEENTAVRVAALEALSKSSRALPTYLKALQSGDAVLAALAAQRLAADSTARFQRAEQILAAYRQTRATLDAETAAMFFHALAECGNRVAQPELEEALRAQDLVVARAAAEALKKLTGADYKDRVTQTFTPAQAFSFAEIKNLKGAWAEIKTEAGTFEIALLPEEAPLTVLNFVRLAEKKYFDGQTIHRVVPNFVVQAGDPRGDGWGGPGYAIRSEFNRLRYVRGMVGMASSGPDTEGSQWFVAHSDQPHLDGLYTVFGRVRKAMEVVDELQVGHHLLQVRIHH
jgi:cyclophilin family peptidyl-prolyl cis-trans isomerase/HEAT repeat protein